MTGSTFDHRALDPVIHSRIRLSVMAVLASVDDAEFTFLRDRVNATDGNLSTHLGRLADAGYVESERALQDGRAVTRYHLTADGQRAFAEYLRHMEALLNGLDR